MKKIYLDPIIKVSKYTFLILFVNCLFGTLLLATENAEGQSLKEINASLAVENLTLKKVFQLLEKETSFEFSYATNNIPLKKKISIVKDNENLYEILKDISIKADVDFKRVNNQIIVKRKNDLGALSVEDIMDDVAISGKVTDEKKAPLPGVSIIIKGTSLGVVTDINGNYTINVPEGSILVYSYIGYLPREVDISGMSVIDVELLPDLTQLDEVVIVGYGSQQKAKMTGSVATVKRELLIDRPIVSVAQGLAGVDPGTNVLVSLNGGAPGEQPAISIRGEYAVTNRPEFTEPLVLVDGFEANIGDVDPNQIQEMTILKDAAATAIYGVRAAEGVILITTKGGTRDKPIQFNYRFQGASQRYTDVPQALGSAEYMEFRNKAWYNERVYRNGDDPSLTNRFNFFSEDVINRARNGEFYSTNWQDILYGSSAPQFSHSLDAFGGTERTSYLISVGSLDQEGINIANDNFKRYNFRVKVDTDVNDWLTIGTNTAFTFSEQIRVDVATTQDEARPSPLFPVTDEALGGTGSYVAGENGVSGNPVMTSDNGSNDKTKRDVMEMQLFAKVKILKGLTFDQKLNYRVLNTSVSDWSNNISYAEYSFDGLTGTYSDPNIVEESSVRRNLQSTSIRSTHLTSQSLLNYGISFNEAHNIKALLGWQVEDIHNQMITAYRENFAIGSLQQLTVGGTENWSNGSDATDQSYLSLIGRLNYDYKSKYLIEFSFRRDGSSEFAPGNRFSFFPALSVGWNMANESFINNMGFIDMLKVRGSIGETGTDNLPNTPPLAYYTRIGSTSGYTWPSAGVQSGLIVASYSNPDLIWETVRKMDIGLDLELFKGKLGVVADYYNNKRINQLVAIPASREFGLGGTAPANIYSSQNKGFEIIVSHRNKIGEVGYRISINAAHTRNEWLERPDDITWDNNEVGFALRNPWGFVMDGYISNQEELDAYNAATSFGNGTQNRRWIGAPKLTEQGSRDAETGLRVLDSDARIDNWDRNFYGNPGTTKLGATLGVNYKGFSLTSVIDGTLGRELTANLGAAFANGTGNIYRAFVEQSFDPETNNDDSALFPIIFAGNWTYNAQQRINASFVRVRNVNLSYNFKEGLVPTLKALKLYVSVENPIILWDDFPLSEYGFDPELGMSTVYPMPKTFTVGLNIGF